VRHPIPAALIALVLAVLAVAAAPNAAKAAIAASLVAVLVIIAATDLERRIIPNRVVLPAAAVVLIANVAVRPGRALEFVLAAVSAAAVFLTPSLISRTLMGMGDAKLALLLGAALGRGVVGALILACFSVVPVAVAMTARHGFAARKTPIPYGPFLAFGGVIVLILPGLVGAGGS
jgi:prepilin signal peptidase PulO-like enzyme (type II secretory pathway)